MHDLPDVPVDLREPHRLANAGSHASGNRRRFPRASILYYMEDFSYKQIADVLAVPIGTVQSRIARAKMRLLRRLSETNPPRPK